MRNKFNIFGILATASVTLAVSVSCTETGGGADDPLIPLDPPGTPMVIPTIIENFGDTGVDVAIYDYTLTKPGVGQDHWLRVDFEKENEEISFSLEVEQISATKTRTIHCDAEGNPMVAFVVENGLVTDIEVFDDEPVGSFGIRSWWSCTKNMYRLAKAAVESDKELAYMVLVNDAMANSVPGGIIYRHEVIFGVSAGISCL